MAASSDVQQEPAMAIQEGFEWREKLTAVLVKGRGGPPASVSPVCTPDRAECPPSEQPLTVDKPPNTLKVQFGSLPENKFPTATSPNCRPPLKEDFANIHVASKTTPYIIKYPTPRKTDTPPTPMRLNPPSSPQTTPTSGIKLNIKEETETTPYIIKYPPHRKTDTPPTPMRHKILPVYPPSSPQTTPTSGIKGSPKSPDSGISSLVATVRTNSLSQSNDLCATNDWLVRTNHSYAARPSTPKKQYKEGTVVKEKPLKIKLDIKEVNGSHNPMPEESFISHIPIPSIVVKSDSLTVRDEIVTNLIGQWYINYYNQALFIGVGAKFIHADFPVLRCQDCGSLTYTNGHFIRYVRKMQQQGREDELLEFDEDDDVTLGLFLPCSANCCGDWYFNCHPVSMETFANHVPFFFSPSQFDPHRFQQFSLRKMVKKQYLSLSPEAVLKVGMSKFLYKQDFGGLDSCVGTQEKILQKIKQKEKHKEENIDPLYPVGPPFSRTGHRYLFPQGPSTGNGDRDLFRSRLPRS